MTEVRGWCPDLFRPMQSGDGWLIRVRPRLARVMAEQASAVSAAAARYGNGLIELTSRGNLQLRGFTSGSATEAAGCLAEAGLADPDPARERRSSLILSPLLPPDGLAVAVLLGDTFAPSPLIDLLPPKFATGISAGRFPLADGQVDLLIRPLGSQWHASLGARSVLAAVEGLPAAALSLLGGSPPMRKRGQAGAAPTLTIGWHPAAAGEASGGAFGFGLPFGQLDADLMHKLASLAVRHGDGLLHVTPWRTLLISGVDDAAVPLLRHALSGLVLDADDPRLLVSACIGAAGCSSGRTDARTDALALLRLGVRAASIHVSGCAKGCAHPGPAALTLVGEAVRDGSGVYALVRDGPASHTPQSDGLDCAQLARQLVPDRGGSADRS
ncbi:precorrin-3B synthase [Lichenicoccus roseus]|uniref:Precorrin-3B synthase n=1 Tax=Lichenicoccus roseus TaxID=2683649 RepID=A0A5R9J0F3_9PROT|nr:precorrin-3B synthase [Lichenicoccus roseus]TLU71012.1 precorrin-3B synthase [Lichenicoccus roseus]